jgi:hypothetical protein
LFHFAKKYRYLFDYQIVPFLSKFLSEKCGTNGILELLERMEQAEQMERDGTS